MGSCYKAGMSHCVLSHLIGTQVSKRDTFQTFVTYGTKASFVKWRDLDCYRDKLDSTRLTYLGDSQRR